MSECYCELVPGFRCSNCISKEIEQLACPFCEEGIELKRSGRHKYSISHTCESGLKISVPTGNKNYVIGCLNNRRMVHE